MSSPSDAPYDTDDTVDMPPAKRSRRETQRERCNGEPGGDNRPKGLTRVVGGVLEHRENDKGEWHPAVYHNDIRGVLIASANQQEAYTHTRKKGYQDDDITSFHPEHKTWGPERENWPDVLFRINKTFRSRQGDSVVEDTASTPKGSVPLWYHDGKIVLDVDNHALRLFPELPAVISSEMEGWEMEAIHRRDTRIHHKDFRARMPHIRGRTNLPIPSLMAISMRMSRFREKGALKAWDSRAGSEAINTFIDQLLGPACVNANDSRGFGRMLEKSEIDLMKKINKGKFPEKARHRDDASNNNTEPTKKRKRRGGSEHDEDEREEVHSQQGSILAQPSGEALAQAKRRKVDNLPDKNAVNSNRYSGYGHECPTNPSASAFQVPSSGPGSYGWAGRQNSNGNPTDTPSCHYPTPNGSQQYGQCPSGYRPADEELGVPMYPGQRYGQYPRRHHPVDDDPTYFGHQDPFHNGFMEQSLLHPNPETPETRAASLSATVEHLSRPPSHDSRTHSPMESGATAFPTGSQTSPDRRATSPMNGSNSTALSNSGFPVATPGLTGIDPAASVVSQLSPAEISALAELEDPAFWEGITSGNTSFGLPSPEHTQPQGTPSYGTSPQQRTEDPPMLENPQDIDFPFYAPTPEQRAIDEWVERCISARFGSVNNQLASMLFESAFRLTTRYPE